MLMSFETVELVDQLGCIKASEVHEVVVYENRCENLNYLLQRDPTNTVNIVDTWDHPVISEGLSGSITEDKKAELEDSGQKTHKENSQVSWTHPSVPGGTRKSRKKLVRGKIPVGIKYIPSEEEESNRC
ncbi:hypothetical protein EVAR_67825_1 [Eumeta japonica]|uniref:Uncharacterized protein n=1 Tax=Eumeta variegata TaxID=151549 RepID=A0A4C1ZSV0_EUMVA|nr:hypothetical protein EVAR_67825_1 [Eumeta japonica]